jgi:hypothetical protein
MKTNTDAVSGEKTIEERAGEFVKHHIKTLPLQTRLGISQSEVDEAVSLCYRFAAEQTAELRAEVERLREADPLPDFLKDLLKTVAEWRADSERSDHLLRQHEYESRKYGCHWGQREGYRKAYTAINGLLQWHFATDRRYATALEAFEVRSEGK